jgi:methionine-gamma-lyase
MRERTDGTGFATRAIHAGERPDPTTHAHNTPIYATATFAFDTAAEKEAAVDRALEWDPTSYFYSRTGNPTNRALEEKVASLEGAEDCVVSASGMAAVASTLFAHLDAGDHIVVGDELFAITRVLWEDDLPRRDIAV